MANDPCTPSLTTTEVAASGTETVDQLQVSSGASKFDCFYVYPTVSTENSDNANLKVQPAETEVATQQAGPFSRVCRVWAPMYRQVTVSGLVHLNSTITATAYTSLASAFEDYLSHDNDGRPIILIGHSQGAVMLIDLLARRFDKSATLRDKLVLAILLGGNVVVPAGKLLGGSFANIPLCSATGQSGCVIAYSSFPATPPRASEFGRPGQGVSLFGGQSARRGVQVACVNPAAIRGGSALLDPVFPATAADGPLPFHSSEGKVQTPWVAYPGLYGATCEQRDGATWLNVTKATGPSDDRPRVRETGQGSLTAAWGYHIYDVNLALGDLVGDVAAAEASGAPA